ncbi:MULTISPECIES: FtsX-like permease family protein [unclassified Clostridioides]|uniref:FtsX-like permease family protein n=1 Tax=unclassified Clostridioides TaxID=2635829 RepID=UPI001D1106B2|nr:ABC transporter permease [Clostridioides sp. ZZV14-6045]MCC0740792.1 ABC transporter permease [Clostridioides sp. ZZV14-5902]
MKINHYVKLSYTNLIRDKNKNIKNASIMIFSFMLFILTISISSSLNKFIKNYILNTVEHSSILIEYDLNSTLNSREKITTILKNNNSILEFYEYKMPIAGEVKYSKDIFNNDKLNSLSLKSGFEKRMPEIINGELFNKNDNNVGIIPKNFDPSGEIGVEIKKEKAKYLDGEKFIGKTITLKFKDDYSNSSKTFEYRFKVIGVYDSVKNIDYPNDVYIPYNDLKYIHDKYNYIMHNESYDNIDTLKTIIALVDSQSNVNTVLSKLESNEIFAMKKAELGPLELVANITVKIGITISIIIFIISILNISLGNINSIKKRQGELGMLRAFGYKESYIKKIIIIESMIINIFSLLVATLFCKIILIIFNIFIKANLSVYMDKINFDIDKSSVIVGIIIMFISIILSELKSIRYINKLNLIDAIKNNY